MRSVPDEGVDLDGINVVEVLEGLLDLALVRLDVDNEDESVVLLNLLHGALGVERVDDDLGRIEAGLARDRLARVLGGARELERLRAVEGGALADLADLVRVDLILRVSKTGRERCTCSHATGRGPYTLEGSLSRGRGLSGGLGGCTHTMLAGVSSSKDARSGKLRWSCGWAQCCKSDPRPGQSFAIEGVPSHTLSLGSHFYCCRPGCREVVVGCRRERGREFRLNVERRPRLTLQTRTSTVEAPPRLRAIGPSVATSVADNYSVFLPSFTPTMI